MKFTEALQHMLKGSRIRREIWPKKYYIKFNNDGLVVEEINSYYQLDREDYDSEDWETSDVPAHGTLLTHYGKDYWLIKETDGTYAILDAETYVEQIKGITEKYLMRDLIYYDFGIVYKA